MEQCKIINTSFSYYLLLHHTSMHHFSFFLLLTKFNSLYCSTPPPSSFHNYCSILSFLLLTKQIILIDKIKFLIDKLINFIFCFHFSRQEIDRVVDSYGSWKIIWRTKKIKSIYLDQWVCWYWTKSMFYHKAFINNFLSILFSSLNSSCNKNERVILEVLSYSQLIKLKSLYS